MVWRYASGLRAFLAETLDDDDCARMVRDRLSERSAAFVHLLRHAVFGNPLSPYRRLFDHAGLAFADIERLVASLGVEGALLELMERGVYVTLDEFKSRQPIRRPGLEFLAAPSDFDNPLNRVHYESRTGGSRGPRVRIPVDLELLAHEAAETGLFLAEFGLAQAPAGMWRELPPGMVGIKNWLRHAKLGRRIEKWFTQRKPIGRLEDVTFHAFTLISRGLGRALGAPMPVPEHVPPGQAVRIARWMADVKRRGTPALMDTNASTGARICLAAVQANLDIAGSCFRLSAEPYTPARARLVEAAGCRAASFYAASEIGYIGLACGAPSHVDDVHVMTDKVALVQRRVGVGAASVNAVMLTALLPSCSKLMVNVDLGDHAVVEERHCGCLLDRLGFHLHAYDVRSYEKLTSAGITFLGADLIALVEELLPGKFGGTAVDYQFVESEDNGMPVVSLLVSPSVGPVSCDEVTAAVYRALAAVPGGGLMTGIWRDAGTLRVVRREPVVTGAMKLLPLHVLRGQGGDN